MKRSNLSSLLAGLLACFVCVLVTGCSSSEDEKKSESHTRTDYSRSESQSHPEPRSAQTQFKSVFVFHSPFDLTIVHGRIELKDRTLIMSGKLEAGSDGVWKANLLESKYPWFEQAKAGTEVTEVEGAEYRGEIQCKAKQDAPNPEEPCKDGFYIRLHAISAPTELLWLTSFSAVAQVLTKTEDLEVSRVGRCREISDKNVIEGLLNTQHTVATVVHFNGFPAKLEIKSYPHGKKGMGLGTEESASLKVAFGEKRLVIGGREVFSCLSPFECHLDTVFSGTLHSKARVSVKSETATELVVSIELPKSELDCVSGRIEYSIAK